MKVGDLGAEATELGQDGVDMLAQTRWRRGGIGIAALCLELSAYSIGAAVDVGYFPKVRQ